MRVRLWHVNLAVWAAVAVVAGLHASELRWAWRELPNYLARDISAPLERELYLAAAERIQAGRELDEARALLERSIAIDPHSDAVYWLGRCHQAARRPAEALEAYRRYLEFDRTNLDAWLRAAHLLESRLELDEARRLLARGRDFFAANVALFEPRLDGTSADPFAEKARSTHAAYETGLAELERAIERIDQKLSLYGAPAGD